MSETRGASPLTAAELKTISRIESFSDIVFGFSLFNLAFNLKVPNTSAQLMAQGPDFLVFLATFAMLCSLWWVHHRLFRDFFRPDPAGLTLNFAFLAAVALFTYPLQLYVKFGPEDPLTVAGYAVGGLFVFGALGAMFAKGVWQLGPLLDEKTRQEGAAQARRFAVLSVSLIVALTMFKLGAETMLTVIVVGFVASSLVRIAHWRSALRKTSSDR